MRFATLTFVALVAIVASTAVAFGPLRHAGFVYEDQSPYASPVSLVIIARTLMSGPTYVLSAVSLGLQSGQSAAMYHAGNVAIHVVNSVLVMLLARVLFRHSRPTAPVLAGLIFLFHPLNSEAVDYITGRSELLVAFGVLVAAIALTSRLTWPWQVVWAVMGTWWACESKPAGFAAVGLTLWLVGLRVRGRQGWRTRRMMMVSLTAWLLVLVSVVVLVLWPNVLLWGIRTTWADWDPLSWIAIQATVLQYFLGMVFLLRGQTVDHDFVRLPNLVVVLALALLVMGVVGIYTNRGRAPLLVWSTGWVLVFLAPRFLIPFTEFLNEHQMYVPMIGISIGLAGWVDR